VKDYLIILAEDIQNKLDIFSKNNRVTLAPILYTAWGILLQRYCSSEDVVFGTTVSGRTDGIKGIEDMVGLFINTIPLRIDTYPCETMFNVVSQVDHILQEREEFEHTPLVDIGIYSNLDSSGTLFDTILVIENYPLDNRLVPEGEDSLLSILSYSIVETTHYDLTVGIIPFKGIEIKFFFRQELFNINAIEQLAAHFKTIIQKIIEQPETTLSQLEIISTEEKNRILNEFNNTALEYPRDKTIHQLFEEQVVQTPDYIALHGCMIAWMDGEVGANRPPRVCPPPNVRNVCITYRQLNDQSNRLTGLLIEKGVLPDTIVGIMVERSIEMIVGIFGILKSGGAYLPIDSAYPQERIDYILKDSSAEILLTNKSEARISKHETNSNDQNTNVQNKNFEGLTVLNFENLNFEIVCTRDFGFRI
jgi:non-ribosomal peptide synthetase component F